MKRRSVLHAGTAATIAAVAPLRAQTRGAAQVLVVGGGYAGATAAKQLRVLSRGRIAVTLIEPESAFVSCPMSNLVLGGSRRMADITVRYDALVKRHGVRWARDVVRGVNLPARTVSLAGGEQLRYDKLVLAPGVGMMWDAVEGLAAANADGRIVQAWKAGAETVALRRQLEDMRDGGVFAISIPELPIRCPPAPYERACQVAWYLKKAKPRSKVLVFDANDDVTSESQMFKHAWTTLYPGLIEYRPQYKLTGVDGKANVMRFEVQDDEKADVINALPPMRAADIAVQAGLNNQANQRWCGVNYQTFESSVARDVFVLGDAIQIAPGMSKSGHMAYAQAKVAAAAIVAQLAGRDPERTPRLSNTCFSFVDDRLAGRVANRHEYVPADGSYRTLPGSAVMSTRASAQEGALARRWAATVWADMLG